MLQFFRKYQTYFFAVITVVIIISFSFFGTYNTLPANAIHEQVTFTAVDGSEIKRMELDEMILFLSSDGNDKRLFGGAWGPNFLNDGVIANDFLATGLAGALVAAYPEQVRRDLITRLEKEKHYQLYTHPQAKFVGVEGAWAYFAPGMKVQFNALREAENPVAPDAFAARVALYLGEKQLPAPILKQILRHQEKQYHWLNPDPNLERLDLTLFGYHTLDDWFGPRFLSIVAEFIVNSSKIAERKGYTVTKSEALGELMRNAEISFQENAQSPHLGVKSGAEYFNEQLRRLSMDHNKAVQVWRQVMLFRRLFQDVGNAIVIDPLFHQQFLAFAQETIMGNLYRLPPDLRFSNYRALQKFEAYLDTVTKRDENLLVLPTTFLSVSEVKAQHPELVQKRYLLDVAEVEKQPLQKRVGLKEMWQWEGEESNWEELKKAFPELGLLKVTTSEERLAALDNLDEMTHMRIDTMARLAILDKHPEWLQQDLREAEATRMEVGISAKGGKPVFGLENREELMRLLDAAPLGEQPSPELTQFSGDQKTYYRISVIERAPNEEILTFADANRADVLDPLLDDRLTAYYEKMRESNPSEFRTATGEWRPYADVKNQVADQYFEPILKAIRKDYAEATKREGTQPKTGDLAASVRFYAYARELQRKLQSGDVEAQQAISSEKTETQPLSSQARLPTDQWKWEQVALKTSRSTKETTLNPQPFFHLSVGEWTPVETPVNGDLLFFQLKDRLNAVDAAASSDQLHQAHFALSDDAQRHYMQAVLNEIKAKQAISVDYLDKPVESFELEQQQPPMTDY